MIASPLLPAGASRGHDVERALLGSILVDPTQLPKAAGVSSRDFFDADLGRVLDAIRDLDASGRPVSDPWVLVEYLRQRSDIVDSCRSPTFVSGLIDCGIAAHVAYYSQAVLDGSRRRSLMAIGEQLLKRLDDPTQPLEEIRGWLEDRAGRLGTAIDAAETVGQIAARIIEDLRRPKEERKPKTVIWPGLGSINAQIGAFLGGELVVLAARPGMGKTALAMQIAMQAASDNHPVLFVSLEMQQTELVMRILCGEAGVDGRPFRTQAESPEDVEKLAAVSGEIRDYPLRVFDSRGSNVTTDRIRAMGRLMKSSSGLGLIVVDYLQLVNPVDKKESREQQVATMTRNLKNLSKELDCPILCLAQLNREAEKSDRPQLSHLRESGAIEQDADAVLFLHRIDDKTVNLGIAKHRHARAGDLLLEWIPHRTRFADHGEANGAKRVAEFDDFNAEGSF